MYGMPSDMGPLGFDTSMLTMSVYMLAGLGSLILGAMALGVITLPAFFIILWLSDRFFGARRVSDRLVPSEGRAHHVPRAAAQSACARRSRISRSSSSRWCCA